MARMEDDVQSVDHVDEKSKHVFVSYSRRDAEAADELLAAFDAAGVRYWNDRRDLKVGQRWGTEIFWAIGEARALVVLLSESSAKSENVKDEVHRAKQFGVARIPVFLEPLELAGGLGLWLGRVQSLDARPAVRAAAFRQLADRLSDRPQRAKPQALQAYSACPPERLPSLAELSDDEVASALERIVAVEGPILGREAYDRLLQFSGDQRLAPALKKRCNRVLHASVNAGRVAVVPDNVNGVIGRTYYRPGRDAVVLRELGPRDITRVPPTELLGLVEAYGASLDSRESANLIASVYEGAVPVASVRKVMDGLAGYRAIR